MKKVELVGKEGTPEVQWIKDTTELDDDFINLLKNAIVDTENSYPDLDEMDNKYIKVEYLAREGLFGNNTYAELDYIPSGLAGAGAHKFGENTDANGNSTETIRISLTGNSRYKDASVEKKVVLKDIREDASFALQDETEIAYTSDLAAFKQTVYDQIVWKSAGAKPEIGKFKIEVKGKLTDYSLETAQLLGLLNVDKTPELKITFAGNEAYREGEITASVKIVDPRPIGEFTIMTTPITYTSDVEKLKQELYDRITWTNGVKPSMESTFHLGILRERPDVNVVLHFQSEYATAVSCMKNKPTNFNVTAEIPCHVGSEIPVIPYYRPGSPELAKAVVEAMLKHNSVLLTNHGQVVCGKDFDQVYERATFFEMACRIIVQSGGDYSVLTPAEIEDLEIYVLGKKTK